jgi:hypothetical protein
MQRRSRWGLLSFSSTEPQGGQDVAALAAKHWSWGISSCDLARVILKFQHKTSPGGLLAGTCHDTDFGSYAFVCGYPALRYWGFTGWQLFFHQDMVLHDAPPLWL